METFIELGKILAEIISGLLKEFRDDLDKGVQDGTPEAQALLDKWKAKRQNAVDAWRNRSQD